MNVAALLLAATLSHHGYLWQRQWDDSVRAALTTNVGSIVVLAAENSTRIGYDLAALRATGKPFGLALRATAITNISVELAAAIARDRPAEIQLDFDCPESKLDSYRQRLIELRKAVAPVPLTFTALPAWLRQPAFSNLVTSADGFVLQVHSFDTTLCDTGKAVRAAADASRYGVPFRVALPTYGYLVAHDRAGKFLGLAAEGPSRRWPAGAAISEVRADPAAMAALVREWTARPPPHLTGIIWYRLPTANDRLNWRWPTLAAVMAGRAPQPALSVELRQPQPGLVEIDLLNHGDADALTPVKIAVKWREAEILACDAVAGFGKSTSVTDTNATRFVGNPRLAPAEHRTIGWLRFRDAKEVACEVRIE